MEHIDISGGRGSVPGAMNELILAERMLERFSEQAQRVLRELAAELHHEREVARHRREHGDHE